MLWMARVFREEPLRDVRLHRAWVGELFRVDAEAEGRLIVLGGWTTWPHADPATARWFSCG